MAGISEEWEDRANEGDGAFATAVAIRSLRRKCGTWANGSIG